MEPNQRPYRLIAIILGAVALILIAIVIHNERPTDRPRENPNQFKVVFDKPSQQVVEDAKAWSTPRRFVASASAKEIVDAKLTQFFSNRRKLLDQLASRAAKAVPREVERLFDALAHHRSEDADKIFAELKRRHENPQNPDDEALYPIWRPIVEAYSIDLESRHWPAEQLLSYGDKVLGSLRPNMVLIGGTDPGAFINTFLNETSGSEHMIFTQNALADGTYTDYLKAIYGDRLKLPEKEEVDAAFQDFVADATKRFVHDRDFPDEPKQVKPDENIQIVDGKTSVGGRAVVMAINERILNQLIQKNPDLTFAMEESLPLKSTYANASPLGPIMELRAGADNEFTADRAAQSITEWKNYAADILNNTTEQDDYPRKAWSHMAVAQANLLAARNFPAEAEQAYQIALQLYPSNGEARSALRSLGQAPQATGK